MVKIPRRRVEVEGDDIVVHDWLEGRPEPVWASLPLAPGLEPQLEGGCARVALAAGGALRIELPSALAWRIESAPCYPRFGEALDRQVLVGEATRFESGTTRFRLEAG